MKRFVKNNLVLIVVLSLCLVATLFLLVWTAMEYIKMSRYIAQTENLRNEISKLIEKKPAPVDGNIPPIEADMKLYRKAADDLRMRFGHPFQPALERFVAILRTRENGSSVTLEEFKTEFFDKWSNDKTTADQIADYKQFQRHYRNWPEAMQEFRAMIAKVTSEPVSDNNIDDIFLSTLGIPRRMDAKPENLFRYLTDFQRELLRITKDKVEFDEPEAMNFSFIIPATSNDLRNAYLPEEYPLITQNFEIIGDIVKRSIDAGIKSFVSFKTRSLAPEEENGFNVFHYSIELTGSMESIRRFAAILDQAYDENRVYLIRSIFLYQDHDPARLLMDPEEIPALTLPNQPQGPPPTSSSRTRRRRPPQGQNAGPTPQEIAAAEREEQQRLEILEQEKSLPYNLRTGYGNIVAGGQTVSRAIIDVEYIMESGN